MKKIILSLGAFLAFGAATAQTMSNSNIYISEGGLISVNQDFANKGVLENHGELHFKKDLNNDGELNSDGMVVFDGYDKQKVTGSHDLELSKLRLENNVDLNTSLKINEELNYRDGILNSSNLSSLIFGENAGHFGASDYSHSTGVVTKFGASSFEFPLGDGANYKGFKVNSINDGSLSAEHKSKEILSGAENLSNGLDYINEDEYWVLKSSKESSIASVKLEGTYGKDVAYLQKGTWKMSDNGSFKEKDGLKQGIVFTSGSGKYIKKGIGVWPNPTQGDFNLKLEGMDDSEVIKIDVTNQDGRAVLNMEGTVRELRKVYSLPGSLITTELTVRVISGNEVLTEKLILAR